MAPGNGSHLWQITAVQDLFWISLLAAGLLLAYYLRDILVPVLLGLGLAYLFNPLIDWSERQWRVSRPVTALLLLLILALVVMVLAVWLVPILVAQTVTLVSELPRYLESISTRYELQMGELPEEIKQAGEVIKKDPLSAIRTLFTGTGRFFGVLGSIIGVTSYVVGSVLLIPIYFFFFAWGFPAILSWFLRFIPASRKERVIEMAGRIDDIVASFFRARLLICVIMAAMFAFGWTLVGVPYAFLLGLVAGLLSLVPFASGLGWPLAILMKWLEATGGGTSFDWMAVLVWPSVVFLVVQFVEGWILTPLIHSGSTNLSSVTILIVVFIGGALGGVLGFILAIPVASSVKMILEESLLPRLEGWAQRN